MTGKGINKCCETLLDLQEREIFKGNFKMLSNLTGFGGGGKGN